MSARVVQVGELSKSFGVNTGVKQGCVLAPVIFNLFLVAVAFVFRHNQGRTQGGGLGLNPPLELDILQKIYYLRKEINCFRILFAC